MKIFETHAHYDDEAFDGDRDSLLEAMLAPDGTLDYIVNVGASLSGCKASVELAKKYPKVYAAVGFHPEEVVEDGKLRLNKSDMEWLENAFLESDKIVAVGEIGLDYYWISKEPQIAETDKLLQKEWFINQLELAYKVKKPVIIHSREACQDTYELLRDNHGSDVGGIIHCYSYSKEAAKQFLDMGFYIGIGGVVTFKNAKKLVEAVNYIPMDRIVLETDCPYMAPEPNRGKRNDSRNIQFVAQKIAQIKNLSEAEVIDITHNNAKRVYQI